MKVRPSFFEKKAAKKRSVRCRMVVAGVRPGCTRSKSFLVTFYRKSNGFLGTFA
jgi:hypothetical protein